MSAGETNEVAGTLHDRAVFWCPRDRNAASTPELQNPLVSQPAQGSKHGVLVHARYCSQVLGGRQPIARRGLPLGNGAPNLTGDLLVQVGGVAAIHLDTKHGARDTSSIMEASASHEPTPSPSAGRRVRAIIDDAWRRARRRRGAILLCLGLVGTVITLLLLRGETESANESGKSAPATAVAAPTVLRGSPYMGVACQSRDALACDRVGLSVRLDEQAVAVTATLGGKSFTLDDPDWSAKADGSMKRFGGFLEPAGLRDPGPLQVLAERPGRDRWLDSAPARFPVTLLIEREDGTTQRTEVRVGLAPGWG
jgi:hypothetical protein